MEPEPHLNNFRSTILFDGIIQENMCPKSGEAVFLKLQVRNLNAEEAICVTASLYLWMLCFSTEELEVSSQLILTERESRVSFSLRSPSRVPFSTSPLFWWCAPLACVDSPLARRALSARLRAFSVCSLSTLLRWSSRSGLAGSVPGSSLKQVQNKHD